MDTSGFFSSSAELLDERVKVLELLTKAFPHRANAYEDEIAAINAAKLIKSGLEIVDSNRVAVDTSALTRWANRKYRNSYYRYQALRGAGIGSDVSFVEVMEHVQSATDMSGEYFSIPKNEADTLLLEMILGLKEQFLTDPQYGLEYFLGKRIRHGTVAGHMRGPAEASHLITERRTANSPYMANDHWLSRIAFVNDGQRSDASDAFDRFSEQYDRLIADVRDKYLHVKSKSHPDGLFDIAVTAPQFHVLKTVATPDIEFEHFVNVCFQTFWALLGPSLKQARDLLTVQVRQEVVRLFGELQAALDEAVEGAECSRNASMAIQSTSTDVQRELDIVGSWFERIEGREANRFSLQHAVEIAVQSTLKSLTTFKPAISWDVQEEIDTTQSVLLLLWEFIFVVLDNVYRRAKVGNSPAISIDCRLDTPNKSLWVSIVNPVGDQVDVEAVEHKLELTRQKIAAGDIIKGAGADRGSGLLKVASLVRDYSSGALEFAFDPQLSRFTTTIQIPVYIAQDAITLPIPEQGAR